jgi:hypothetical protein
MTDEIRLRGPSCLSPTTACSTTSAPMVKNSSSTSTPEFHCRVWVTTSRKTIHYGDTRGRDRRGGRDRPVDLIETVAERVANIVLGFGAFHSGRGSQAQRADHRPV